MSKFYCIKHFKRFKLLIVFIEKYRNLISMFKEIGPNYVAFAWIVFNILCAIGFSIKRGFVRINQ